jgi:hypothetical protein
MNQQPDELFRQKLEGYQKQAPARAWDKLEAGLDKKSNKGLWLKVAASLLFIGVAAYLLLSNAQLRSDEGQSHTIAENKIVKPSNKEIKKKIVVNEKVSKQFPIENKSDLGNSERQKTNTSKNIVGQTKTEIAKQQERKDFPVKEDQVINSVVDTSPIVNSSPVIKEANVVVTTTSAPAKGKTIIFTVEEVNEKYLDKNALTEATSSDNNPSTLKKLLNKASDLTRDQDPIGELRQKKDEILALNFKKKNNVAKTDKAL